MKVCVCVRVSVSDCVWVCMRVRVCDAAAVASVREARIKEEQQALADEGVCVSVRVRACECVRWSRGGRQ